MTDSAIDIISQNFSEGKQTFLIPLTYQDVTVAASDLDIISYGGDVWELRVDLLQQLGSTSPTPSVEYVTSQLQFLQRASDLPIIFTIRTVSQGGKFPDDAEHSALQLMLMAIRRGCQYIDVECDWSPAMIDQIAKQKRCSKIITSSHEWTGKAGWKNSWLSK